MTQPRSSDAPTRTTRRIVGISLGVAVAVGAVGVASTAIWLSSARDPACGDSDCDQGVALISLFFMLVSLAVGAVTGAGTAAVLTARNRPTGHRRRVLCQAVFAASLPLGFVLLYLSTAI